MIEFLWPWVGWLSPLPLLVRWLLPAAKTIQQAALKVPQQSLLWKLGDKQVQSGQTRQTARLILAFFAWLLLLLALARPQWIGEPLVLPLEGRDLLLAVDISDSMNEQDLIRNDQSVNRLTVVKQVLDQFIRRRSGDRIGLILFGTRAYLHTPLTFDRETVRLGLKDAILRLAGPQTAIGDAIGLAIKRLEQGENEQKVLILLTDGQNTAGNVKPLEAAEVAAQVGMKIYTIGVGADEMIRRSFFGNRRVNPSRDLDEKTLRAISEQTGGKYFRAHNVQELQQIYQVLDQLEPLADEEKTYRPITELFHMPLALAFLWSMLLTIVQIIPNFLALKKGRP